MQYALKIVARTVDSTVDDKTGRVDGVRRIANGRPIQVDLDQIGGRDFFEQMTALRALDAVARLGSISSAADKLSLTRSAVSHRISTLEEQLGFALTERVGRGIRLTFRGEQFAREVQQILERVQLAAAGQHGQQIAGRLCVSCNTGFASAGLCQHINES